MPAHVLMPLLVQHLDHGCRQIGAIGLALGFTSDGDGEHEVGYAGLVPSLPLDGSDK